MTATTVSTGIHSDNSPSICLGQPPTELTDTALHGPDARTRSSNAQTSLMEVLRVGAQRWHAGAEGSSAQIREVSLSCIRYRVTAKSTRRIAITVQRLMRDIRG